MRVLVVDDSALMRKLIARSLASTGNGGIELVEASDGMEALALMTEEGSRVDLIICDLNMPSVDGLSLLRSVRSSPALKDVPFILVTADVSDARARQAVREGAAGIVGKPFRAEEIAALVRRRALHGRRATSSVFGTDSIARMMRAAYGPVDEE